MFNTQNRHICHWLCSQQHIYSFFFWLSLLAPPYPTSLLGMQTGESPLFIDGSRVNFLFNSWSFIRIETKYLVFLSVGLYSGMCHFSFLLLIFNSFIKGLTIWSCSVGLYCCIHMRRWTTSLCLLLLHSCLCSVLVGDYAIPGNTKLKSDFLIVLFQSSMIWVFLYARLLLLLGQSENVCFQSPSEIFKSWLVIFVLAKKGLPFMSGSVAETFTVHFIIT